MPVWLTFVTAIDSLGANRVRTALTMLGVVIGVAAVVTMVGLGEGARSSVQSTIRSMGTNMLSVRPGSAKRRDMRSYSSRTLTVADADKIREIPGVVGVAPESSTSAQVEYLANNTHSQIVGTTPDYLSVRAMELGTGRFLNAGDVGSRRRVAILGSEVATLLFGGLDPLGERIKIRGSGFRVIGTMAEKGDMGWYQPDNQIIVPISTYQRQLYYDFLTSSEPALRFLLDTVGSDRVVVGSDWPFVPWDPTPAGWLEGCKSISQEEKERISWRNLEQLLGI